jgi:hypothetical protein
VIDTLGESGAAAEKTSSDIGEQIEATEFIKTPEFDSVLTPVMAVPTGQVELAAMALSLVLVEPETGEPGFVEFSGLAQSMLIPSIEEEALSTRPLRPVIIWPTGHETARCPLKEPWGVYCHIVEIEPEPLIGAHAV